MAAHDATQVLVVDDDRTFSQRAASELERRGGFEVDTATDLADVLAKLGGASYDCVVSAFDLAEGDGLDLRDAVRDDGFEELPFILHTEPAVVGDRQVDGRGTSDILPKPDTDDRWDHLADRIREAVQERRDRPRREAYRALMDLVEDPMFVLDRDGTLIRANPPLGALLEVDPEDLAGVDGSALVADGESGLAAAVKELIDAGEPGPVTGRVDIDLPKGGSVGADVILMACYADDGTFDATVGLVRRTGDSTFDWEAGTDREQVEKYETILRALGDPVYAVDAEGRIAFVNEAYAEQTDYSIDELIGMPVGELRRAEAVEAVEDAIAELWHSDDRSKDTVELERSGEHGPRFVENHIALLPPGDDGEFRGTAGVIRDVTDRVQRERTLEQYRSLVDAMTDPAAIYDRDGRYRLVNETLAEKRLGREPEAVVGERSELVERIREDGPGDPYQALIEGERDEIRGELERTDANGNLEVVDYRMTPLVIEGERRGAVSVSRDISAQKAHERQLRETRTVLRTVVENLPVGILVEDQDRTILVANGTLGDILGVSMDADDLMGRSSTAVMEELGSLFQHSEQFIETFETHVRSEAPHRHEEWNLNDGRIVERDYLPYTLGDAQASMWIFREVTDQREREHELQRQNERLEEFASMVSHDLRNPLNVAEGRLELANEEIDNEHLEHVSNAHERINALIDDLLALARAGSTDQDETVDLAELSSTCWETVATGDAALEVDADAEIVSDASRLRQLLENLFRNAVEHGGDGITVRVGETEDGFFVEDDGVGIHPDERADIFEPGFSTMSEGTGLGLSIVRQVADEHGWEISVTESSDGGARFEVGGVQFC